MNKLALNEQNSYDYHLELLEQLSNKQQALTYLQVALDEYEDDQDAHAFMIALRNVTEAQGGINELALKTKLNRQNLYRVLSNGGNPKLSTLLSILRALNFKLAIA